MQLQLYYCKQTAEICSENLYRRLLGKKTVAPILKTSQLKNCLLERLPISSAVDGLGDGPHRDPVVPGMFGVTVGVGVGVVDVASFRRAGVAFAAGHSVVDPFADESDQDEDDETEEHQNQDTDNPAIKK